MMRKISTSSQILSNLDLERLMLVLRTRFVHITSRIHQNCDRIFTYFWFLPIHSYAPGIQRVRVDSASDEFCHLLTIFANSLDPDQALCFQ